MDEPHIVEFFAKHLRDTLGSNGNLFGLDRACGGIVLRAVSVEFASSPKRFEPDSTGKRP